MPPEVSISQSRMFTLRPGSELVQWQLRLPGNRTAIPREAQNLPAGTVLQLALSQESSSPCDLQWEAKTSLPE